MTLAAKVNPVSAMDYLPQDKMKELQLERLKWSVDRSYNNVEFYRNKMNEVGMTPDKIRTLEDIKNLPFMYKADLRDTYPTGLFASPMQDIVRLHASSGTTGKPIVVAYTKRDIEIWASAVMRALASAGLSNQDIVQISFGYGLFTGGLGVHYGTEALGATVIPASGGNTERQIMLMKDFGVTGVLCTPSYFMHLCEKAAEMGVDIRDLPLRTGVFGAEPWTQAMRERIESMANIRAYDIYGLSEITGPGVACACQEREGLHFFEDLFYPEIINPETLEVLPDGETGELVITTLAKEAMPMIRYRTRDITRIIPERCACGRTVRRIDRFKGRSDDMFIIRGVNVFPSQIETAIMKIQEVLPIYQIVLTRGSNNLDNLEVDIEVDSSMLGDTVSAMEDVRMKINRAIEGIIGIKAVIKMLSPNSIARVDGKAKRVIDKRNLIE